MSNWINRKHEKLKGETLQLASKRGIDVPNDVIRDCTLVDCRLQVGYPRGLTLFCSTLVNTTIEVLRTCCKSWGGCFFDSCTFKGNYYDTLFGGPSEECTLKPGLRNCDFTGAALNQCEFMNCNPDDLLLPGWPHVTIFHPRQNAEDFASLKNDSLLSQLQESMGNTSPFVVAVIYHLPAYFKHSQLDAFKYVEQHERLVSGDEQLEMHKTDISLDALREQLQKKPYLFM